MDLREVGPWALTLLSLIGSTVGVWIASTAMWAARRKMEKQEQQDQLTPFIVADTYMGFVILPTFQILYALVLAVLMIYNVEGNPLTVEKSLLIGLGLGGLFAIASILQGINGKRGIWRTANQPLESNPYWAIAGGIGLIVFFIFVWATVLIM